MLVGRDKDWKSVLHRIHASPLPLTLVGPAGVGKSALAVAVCSHLSASGKQRHRLDFSGDADAALNALSTLLSTETVIHNAIILLDNTDGFHAKLRSYLNQLRKRTPSPTPTLLLTSRTRVGYAQESVHYVRPLSVLDGVELFRRAALSQGRKDSSWDPMELSQIVRQLDCIPLALELCARHAVTTPLSELHANLNRSQSWLTNPDADCQPSHLTWDTAVSQSVARLPTETRALLRVLALFDGRFTFRDVTSSTTDSLDVLPQLTELHEQSLLNFDPEAENYWLLRSVRSYVRMTDPPTRLEAASFEDFLHSGAERALRTSNAGPAVAWLIRHRTSLLEALTSSTRPARERAALLLAAARAAAWCGPTQRTLAALDGLDMHAWDGLSTTLRAPLLQARAKLHERLGNNELALRDYLLARKLGAQNAEKLDPEAQRLHAEFTLSVLTDLGTFYNQQGNELSHSYYTDALELATDAQIEAGQARLWAALATRATERREFDEAGQLFERALKAALEEDSPLIESVLLSNRGVLRQEQGLNAEARADFVLARDLHHRLGHQRFEAIAEFDLGCLTLEEGRYPEARIHFESSLSLATEVEDRGQTAMALTLLSTTVSLEGNPERAGQWLADARTMLTRVANPHLLAAHAVHSAQLHANTAQHAFLSGDPTTYDRELQATRAALEHEWQLTSDELRLAQRLLRKRLELCSALPNSVLIARDGGWLHKPPQKRVVLKFDSPQRRVLGALVAHHAQGAACALAADALVRHAWPAENLTSKSAMNRLHVALNALRKCGLTDHLQYTSGGYVLLRVVQQP